MKKRLLSAALALAMVLTLLPATVFAADTITTSDANGNSPGNGTTSVSVNGTTGKATWTYKETNADGKIENKTADEQDLTSGVIVGSRSAKGANFSGTYYTDFEDAYKHKTSNSTFILLGDVNDASSLLTRNITVDVNGHTFAVGNFTTSAASDDNSKGVTQLIFRDYDKTGGKGAVTGSIEVTDKNFTLNLTNVSGSSSAVAVKLTESKTTGRTLSVTADNSKMGAVEAVNAKVSVNGSNGASIASVKTTADGTNGANARTGGSITLGTRSTVGGAVDMYGQGSITLTGRSEIKGDTTLYGAKKGDNGGTTVPSWKTTVTVTNSTMGKIKQGTGDENGHKIDVKDNSTMGEIDLSVGGISDIDFTSSKAGAPPAVKIAKGTVDIKNSNVGNITAGLAGERAGVTITVGTRNAADTSEVGNITGITDGASPSLILNGGKVGEIKATPVAVVHEVWGGSAKTAIDKANLKGGLDKGYQVKSDGYYTYTTKFQDVIDAYKADSNTETTLVGETIASGAKAQITFQWDDTGTPVTLAVISINKGNYLDLPSVVNGTTVQYWYDSTTSGTGDPTKEGLQAGKSYQFTDSTTLSSKINANPTQKLTGVKAEDTSSGLPITATISGNTINLSGALSTNGVTGLVEVTLEIDGADGPTFDVGWHSENGTITVSNIQGNNVNGVLSPVNRSNQVQIFNTIYTVTGTGLKARASKVDIVDAGDLDEVPITVSNANGGMSGSYVVTGQNLKDIFETAASSSVNFTNANGVMAALNALAATSLSESQVTSIVNSARSSVASYENKYHKPATGSWAAKDFPSFDTVEVTPYLDITASNPTISGSSNPSITLTMTLKYRYRVKAGATPYAASPSDLGSSKSAYAYKELNGKAVVWEQTGNLSVNGDCGEVEITLTMPAELAFADGSNSYVHHDGYVYELEWTDNAAKIENINGFADTKFVINNTVGTVEVYAGDPSAAGATPTATFDNLQDAVDVVKNNQYIVVNDNFNGAITVTGDARAFTIKAGAGKTVTLTGVNGASTTYEYITSSNEYKIQLTKNTAETGKNIVVASATGGSASVTPNPASNGQTVTVTLSPASGYSANGVTVKTKAGAAVSVSGSGTKYTFTYPNGAESVTVTPSFTKNQATNATVTVSSPAQGTAITSAGNNQVPAGTTVTVTTIPNNNYRTMGLYVNGATATRTGDNSFRFVVPSNTSNVVVTPRFDVDNGTRFEDVWSTAFYSNPVSWAVRNGITNGTDTYLFSPDYSCTREDMVTFLWRAAGSPSVGNVTNPFWDVTPGSYYYNAVMWAVRNGITNGVSANQFGVGQTVSRAQTVTFLYRAAGSPTASTNSGFYDVNSREYYAKAVSWANAKGITNGDGGPTIFNPNGACTRGQIVTFLYRDRNNVRA